MDTSNLHENLCNIPKPPEPYAEAYRFEARGRDETKTQRTETENGKMATFFDESGKKVKEVTIHDDNTTTEAYYDEYGSLTHTINRNEQGAIIHAEAFDKEGNKLSWQDENGEVHPEGNSNIGIKFGSSNWIHGEYGFCENDIDKIYQYDESGKIKSEEYNTGNFCHVYLYEYGDNENLTHRYYYNGYPSQGLTISLIEEYDSDNRLVKSAYSDGTLCDEYEYDTDGRLVSIRDRDGWWCQYEYNENGYSEIYNYECRVDFDSKNHPIKVIDSDHKCSYIKERDADGVWHWVEHKDTE